MRIGVDLGGTKIEAIGLAQEGEELLRMRVPTPTNYPGTIDAISDLVARVESQTGRTGTVGVGIPGAADPVTGLIKNANSIWLIGHALEADLSDRLSRPVRLQNDANCFALSEAVDGAAAGADIVFGAILGTGVGGGIVVHGRPLEGSQRITGEWGHNPLPWPTAREVPGPECYCGLRGCIETFVSGPGMERDHVTETGERRTTHEIASAMHAGAAAAVATYQRYVDRLARGLATVINLLDPHVVVLGGGMSNLQDLPEHVASALPPYVFSADVRTRIVKNAHGDSSGVRGAAWLWPADGG